MTPDGVEIRVVGCLIEKQRTTPDAYPLSLNALRLACNQSTNRDPVVEYSESEVVDALRRLAQRRWTRLASGAGSRARKYRHLLDEALGLSDAEVSVLAVLMLRGPQTPGELKQRAERLHAFNDLAAVYATLDALAKAGHVARIGRRPGQKEERYEQLLGDGDEEDDEGPPLAATADEPAPEWSGPGGPDEREGPDAPRDVAEPAAGSEPEATASALETRLASLESELNELREELAALRDSLR